jgi:Flp pilus assembly protein CpaB
MPLRSPRALALRAGAVLVAVVTAVVVASDLATLHRRARALGAERDALVARHDLHVGDTIEAADIAVRVIHAGQLPTGAVVGRGTAIGRVVAVPVLRGNYITRRSLASRRRTGLDGVVPVGMRAMRVVVTDALRPRAGAAVDVLASYDIGAGSDAGTFVVAAGIIVLASDARASGAGTGRDDSLGVTVLVDPEQAERLADAQANAVLTLTLVPPEEAARR